MLQRTCLAAAFCVLVFTPLPGALALLTEAAAGGDPVVKTFVGLASYYGPGFHGRRTASGEIFDMHELVAAHRTLPLGTVARVTNLANGRSVVLRINDRGPYIRGRVLDVSKGAAKALAFVRAGTTRVRIDVLPKGANPRRQWLEWRHATRGASRPARTPGLFERTRG
jgi:rare lipoprotein A (peptidoglycan hydrolase)